MFINGLPATLAALATAVLFGSALQDTPASAAGGGGTGAPASGDAPVGDIATAEPDVTADAEGHEAGGAADDDVDDAQLPDESDDVDHLPEANVRTRLRRQQRFLSKHGRPLLERLVDPATGRHMSPQRLDQVLASSREFETIDRVLRASPAAVEFLMKEEARLAGRAPANGEARHDDAPADFDAANWPFEVDSAEGKALLQLAKDNHELKATVRELRGGVTGVKSTLETQQLAGIEQQWKQAAFTAANDVDPVYRAMFVRSVGREFQKLKASGQLTRANAREVIDTELREVRAATKGKKRDGVNRQSAAVATNAGLPRVPKPGTVVAAGSEGAPKRETIKDASKGFLSKYRG